MKRFIGTLAIMLAVCGCRGYIGGIDDSDMQSIELVFVNRSRHDIEVTFERLDWIGAEDTIFLEAGNGLWKKKFDNPYHNLRFDDGRMQVRFDEERVIFMDYMSGHDYNPCRYYQGIQLNDSRGQYVVYEYSDAICNSLFKWYDKLKILNMTSIPPIHIDSDQVTEGSAEVYARSVYAAGKIRDRLALGAVVAKETDGADKAEFMEGLKFEAASVEKVENVKGSRKNYVYSQYYSADELRRMSVALFGCDFAQLTGREAEDEMDRQCGIIYSHYHIGYYELFKDAEAPQEILDVMDKAAVVSRIEYGRLMFLLAEGNCSAGMLDYHTCEYMEDGKVSDYHHVKDAVFHLITLDDEGRFTCRSGGEELIDIYRDGIMEQPLLPMAYSLTDFSGETAYLHIKEAGAPTVPSSAE